MLAFLLGFHFTSNLVLKILRHAGLLVGIAGEKKERIPVDVKEKEDVKETQEVGPLKRVKVRRVDTLDPFINRANDFGREHVETSVGPHHEQRYVIEKSEFGIVGIDAGFQGVGANVSHVVQEQHEGSDAHEVGHVGEEHQKTSAGMMEDHLDIVVAMFSEDVEDETLGVVAHFDEIVLFQIRGGGREREILEAVDGFASASQGTREEILISEHEEAGHSGQNEIGEFVNDRAKTIHTRISILLCPFTRGSAGDDLVTQPFENIVGEEQSRGNEDNERVESDAEVP